MLYSLLSIFSFKNLLIFGITPYNNYKVFLIIYIIHSFLYFKLFNLLHPKYYIIISYILKKLFSIIDNKLSILILFE